MAGRFKAARWQRHSAVVRDGSVDPPYLLGGKFRRRVGEIGAPATSSASSTARWMSTAGNWLAKLPLELHVDGLFRSPYEIGQGIRRDGG